MKGIRIELQQNSPEWFAARFGNFTASAIYNLMTKGKSKADVFGQSAKSYIEETATGRLLRPGTFTDGDAFQSLNYRASCDNYATRWGHDNEDAARQLYALVTGAKVSDGAMYRHAKIETLTASPDGLVGDDGLVEIKCPYTVGKWVHYAANISDGESLKAVEPKYYWQVQCQLAVTGRAWCDFVVYDPAMANPIHVTRIERNEEDIAQLLERVTLAEEIVKQIINKLQPQEL